jgi:hypothetical protein
MVWTPQPQPGSLPPAPASTGEVFSWAGKLTRALSDFLAGIWRRVDSMIAFGATSDRPTAEGSRRLFYDQTTGVASVDVGSWVDIGGGGGGLTNLDGGSASSVYGGVTGVDGGGA